VKLVVAVKNKWSGAWMQAWFYCKVPLIWVPSPGQGKDIYALHSYMTRLDFVMDPSFNCPNGEVGDMAFIKATCTISGRDAVEDYLAYGLSPCRQASTWARLQMGKHWCQRWLFLCQSFMSPGSRRRRMIVSR
jgi:hypothetical protein